MRNRHAFDIYAFTIDMVPLVFQDYCFAGHIRHQTKHNADHRPKNEKTAHPTCKSKASIDMEMISAQPAAHSMKTEARGASPAVAAPGVDDA